MIDIRGVKEQFTSKFPESSLSIILIRESQELTVDEFLAKVQTWIWVLDSDKDRARYTLKMRGVKNHE